MSEFPHAGRAWLILPVAQLSTLQGYEALIAASVPNTGFTTSYGSTIVTSDDTTKKALPVPPGGKAFLSGPHQAALVYGLGSGWSRPKGSPNPWPTKNPFPTRINSYKKGTNAAVDNNITAAHVANDWTLTQINDRKAKGFDHARLFFEFGDLYTAAGNPTLHAANAAAFSTWAGLFVNNGMTIVIAPDDGSGGGSSLNAPLQNLSTGTPYNYVNFAQWWINLITFCKQQSWWNPDKVIFEMLNEPGILPGNTDPQYPAGGWGQGTSAYELRQAVWQKVVYDAMRSVAGGESTIIVPHGPYCGCNQFLPERFIPTDENFWRTVHHYPNEIYMNQGGPLSGSAETGLQDVKGFAWGQTLAQYRTWIAAYDPLVQFDPLKGYKQVGDAGYRGANLDAKQSGDANYTRYSAQIAYRRITNGAEFQGVDANLAGLRSQRDLAIAAVAAEGSQLFVGEYAPTIDVTSATDATWPYRTEADGDACIADFATCWTEKGIGICYWMDKLMASGASGNKLVIAARGTAQTAAPSF